MLDSCVSSLQWHPDRWARHPEYVERATEAFELVSEAYTGLQVGVCVG
jgi:DnaJ-class molecular chaperone